MNRVAEYSWRKIRILIIKVKLQAGRSTETAPEMARRLKADGVDAVLLTST